MAKNTARLTSEAQEIEEGWGLLQTLQSGAEPEEVFRGLFQRYARPLNYFFANRGFSREECQDLVQETFLAIFRDIHSLRDAGHFESWMFGIAANLWRNAMRRTRAAKRDGVEVPFESTPQVAEEMAGLALQHVGPDRLIAEERLEMLRRALDALPTQMRQCVMLRLDQDLKYREIAEVTGVALNTVRSQLAQARQRLRDQLETHFTGFDFEE